MCGTSDFDSGFVVLLRHVNVLGGILDEVYRFGYVVFDTVDHFALNADAHSQCESSKGVT